jgi:hypothetical protein
VAETLCEVDAMTFIMCQKGNFPLNKIEEKFATRFRRYGGVLLLTRSDAIDMVQLCIDEGGCVLGIDGFWIRGDMIQPSLENSVDFSSKDLQESYLDPAFRDPIRFLESRSEEMMFEVICRD